MADSNAEKELVHGFTVKSIGTLDIKQAPNGEMWYIGPVSIFKAHL